MHKPNQASPRRRAPAAMLSLTLALAACGGSDDEPAPPVSPNGALTAQQVIDAQATVERNVVVLDAGPAALTAAQIDSQRAALDGATTDGTGSIEANQSAIDAAADLVPIV